LSVSVGPALASARGERRFELRWEVVLVTLALFGAAVYQFDAIRKKKRTQPAGESQTVGTPLLGGPFELVDMYGKPVTDKDLMGKYALLYFGFTYCPDICPNEMRKMDRALKLVDAMSDVGGEGILVQPVFISVDPQRDTPQRLQEYARQSGYHPRTIWLTGSDEQLRKVAKAYRMYYSPPPKHEEDYQVDHSIFFFLLNPEGKVIDYYGKNTSDQDVAQHMRIRILQDEEKQRTLQLVEQLQQKHSNLSQPPA